MVDLGSDHTTIRLGLVQGDVLVTRARVHVFIGVWIFWGESKALFLHLTNRCREN